MRDIKTFSPGATTYAPQADFCRMFNQDMKRLYLLSLLLTAGQRSAERCFASSLGDCMDSRPVFKEWTDSWTRRVVLQNAIRMWGPGMNNEDEASQSRLSSFSSELNPALRAVLQLKTFQRFVFVISVLEGYSDHECSLLLRSSKRDVVAAKAAALRRLAMSDGSKEFRRTGSHAEQRLAPMG
jgi:hypothetical protein